MLVVDEYLAVRVLAGDWPDDDPVLPRKPALALAPTRAQPFGRPLSRVLASLPGGDIGVVRWPHPEVLQVLDPRPLLDEAAALAARYGGTGLLIAETLVAGLAHGRQLWFGTQANVGRLTARAAGELGIKLHVLAAA